MTLQRLIAITSHALLFIIIGASLFGHSRQSHAAWFTASGQAIVIHGDREAARQEATEEAIRQALLFAGASVSSVQQISNGLLQDEQLEIRASGEVSAVELIDEVYENGIVTVSIRADIFANKTKCSAADYTKRVASTYFPIRYQAQAANGQLHALGKEVALKFQGLINRTSAHLALSHLEPYVFDWHKADIAKQARYLAEKANSQYAVFVSIDDISVDKHKRSAFEFYKGDQQVRAFDYTLTLVDGASGETVFTQTYRSKTPWEFDSRASVDVGSKEFWRSLYGENVIKQLNKGLSDINEFAQCEPTMGRVLAVANNQVQINLGRNHKVQPGDRLTLFNVKQLSDTFGHEYRQFVLHPTPLIVQQVFSNTATLTTADNSYIGDAQPNDYVARQ
uniref:flagella assembly protein FlgT n=1 Tax=Ningiella ruwaisensis TaxID=2364274 RepID=UPI00109FA47C|nr:flagella assembly protein FlgT [Ningiella ruwaisensis]